MTPILPPVIALPGAVSGTAPLAAALERLFPGREVRVVDVLDFATDGNVTFASWTEAFLDQLPSGKPALLFGYSMGARLALHLLRADPSRWDSATLVSGHPGLRIAEEKAARILDDEAWAQRAEATPWSRFLAEWEARPIFRSGIPPGNWSPELARIWDRDRQSLESRRTAVATSLRVWSLGRQDDFRPFLAECPVPVLWVTGALDEKFTDLGRQLTAHCPCIHHHIIPEAGHRLPWERDINTLCANPEA